MANFSGKMGQIKQEATIDDFIRDTQQFEAETFGIPDDQSFPHDHFEFIPFTVNGTVGIGKTTFLKKYIANVFDRIWGKENVNYCEIVDPYAGIEQVSKSSKWIHLLVLDDAVDILDSRQSMKNAKMSQIIYTIRHDIQERAMRGEGSGHRGGLVFFAVLTQDHKAIDKRLREMTAFDIFKGYSKAAEEIIWDENLIELLKHMHDQAVRVKSYEWRKTALCIDKNDMFTFFYADTRGLDYIEFAYAKAENMAAKQKDWLIERICNIDNFLDWDRARQKGRLFKLLDQLKQEARKMYISDSCFTEVIYRTIDTLETRIEEEETEEAVQTPAQGYTIEPNFANVDINNGRWTI
ncbi:MAG: hypothetical protein KGY74_09815, partial [Candidatus Cloacimonetes bacterium]|nr:hypothetical protein [Candidatus Cloacimonadota bacterium]